MIILFYGLQNRLSGNNGNGMDSLFPENHYRKRSNAEGMDQPVEYKVSLFIDGKLVAPSMYSRVFIANKTVDRIVNEVYDQIIAGAGGERENVFSKDYYSKPGRAINDLPPTVERRVTL